MNLDRLLAFSVTVLRMSPCEAWNITLCELLAIAHLGAEDQAGGANPPERAALAKLMRRFPDRNGPARHEPGTR